MSTTLVTEPAAEVASSPVGATDHTYRVLVSVSSPGRTLDLAAFNGIDWDELVRQARHHSLFPMLAHRLLESSLPLPCGIRSRLKQEFQSNLLRNFALLEESLRICRALLHGRIDAMPYKGPVMAELLWGSFALRECSDIDVLVRRADVDRAGEALKRIGYNEVSPIPPSLRGAFVRDASEEQFRHGGNNIFLELQWAPAPQTLAVRFDEDQLWRNRTTTIDVAGDSVSAPSPEDLFALLAIHGWKHNWSKLIWVADLAQLIRQRELDWDRLHRSASRDGWRRILSLAVAMVQRVYGEAARAPFEIDERIAVLAGRLEANLRAANNPSYLEWHRLMLSARDIRISQLRQLRNFIFMPGLAEYSSARLPEWASAGYRAIRVARVLRLWPSRTFQ